MAPWADPTPNCVEVDRVPLVQEKEKGINHMYRVVPYRMYSTGYSASTALTRAERCSQRAQESDTGPQRFMVPYYPRVRVLLSWNWGDSSGGNVVFFLIVNLPFLPFSCAQGSHSSVTRHGLRTTTKLPSTWRCPWFFFSSSGFPDRSESCGVNCRAACITRAAI